MVIRYINTTSSDLYHHGIKGQKWGKLNGPPYPLDSDISTGRSLKTKEKKYVSKLIKNEERSTNSKVKRLELAKKKEEKDLERVQKKYDKKYDKAKTEKKKQKVNEKYASKLNKEYNDVKKLDIDIKERKEESKKLIESYKNYSSKDISDDKKAKANAAIKVAIGFVPVVGNAYAISTAPSEYVGNLRESRNNKVKYK